MINNCVLTGRLTKDIELRKTPNGASVVKFQLAVQRDFKQQGQPDADFINCIAWNKNADAMEKYLGKGSLIGIEGRIQTSSFTDKDGKRVFMTEINIVKFSFLESKGGNSNQSQNQNVNYGNASYGNASYGNTSQGNSNAFQNEFGNDTLDIASDELPF